MKNNHFGVPPFSCEAWAAPGVPGIPCRVDDPWRNADLWVLRADLRPLLIAVGAAAVVLMIMLIRALWPSLTPPELRAVRWLLAGSLLSAVPFTGTPIGSRCLVVPLLGGAVAIALVLHRWWAQIRCRPGMTRRLMSVLCWGLVLIHMVLAPIARLAAPALLRRMMNEHLVTVMNQADLDWAAGSTVVVLNAPDIAVGLHLPFYRWLYRLPMSARWQVLSWAPHDHRFYRTAPDTLEMELVGGSIDASHLQVGDVLEIAGMQATVLQRGRSGPSRIRFRFDRPLDDQSMVLLVWKEERLQRFHPRDVAPDR